MRFNDGLIGNEYTNRTLQWYSSDGEEKYIENLKNQSEDWYYRNASIEYRFNDYGHRSKQINELDFDNYILFTGCSHTEGVGIELEKTYPYLLAKLLNVDYYNMAVQGTGIDVVEYNLLSWFAKFSKKPKFVVVQWPDHSRFLSQYPGYENFIPNGTWAKNKNFEKFFAAGEISGFYNARKNISYRLIYNVLDVPIIGVYIASLRAYDSSSVGVRRLDQARDMQHSGIKTNEDTANRLFHHIGTLNI
jgi:hypothetical protein